MLARRPLIFSLAAILSLPVLAHHSLQAAFDTSQQVRISGVVTEYVFVNPHVRILIDADIADGSVERWVAEGGAVQVLRRKGWNGDEFAPGDRVVVNGNPARDGSRMLNILTVGLPDGRDLTLEGIDFDAIDELRRQQSVNR